MPRHRTLCGNDGGAGEAFEEVHRWWMSLRASLLTDAPSQAAHHLAGVEQVRKIWGDQAAAAAWLHIIADLKQEVGRRSAVSEDEQHYQRMGLF